MIHPYHVGTGKSSTAIVLPSELVKSLNIDPSDTYVMISQNGSDELKIKVIKTTDN